MKVIKVSKQGYCNGVNRALDIINLTYNNNKTGKQVYILGDIVNNSYVSKQLENQGIITIPANGKTRVEMLEKIDDGIVILTAHGVSPEVRAILKSKELSYVDATCPFVSRVSDRITKSIDDGYDVIYIGKHNHPESEGILGINRKKIHLVTNTLEVKNLKIKSNLISIDTQTTLSDFYTKPIIDEILIKYPQAILSSGVCDATTQRQQALISEIQGDICIVVGDKNSSNANELLKIGNQFLKTYLVNSVEEIKKEWLENVKAVTLTSAASTPKQLTDEIFNYLINYT